MRRSELAYIIQMARADQNQYGLDCTGSRLENLGACPQEVLGVQYQLWASGTTKDQFLAQIAMAIIPVPGIDDLSGLADAGLAAAEDTGIAASRQAGSRARIWLVSIRLRRCVSRRLQVRRLTGYLMRSPIQR